MAIQVQPFPENFLSVVVGVECYILCNYIIDFVGYCRNADSSYRVNKFTSSVIFNLLT